jgi:hypothetical protein
VSVSGQRATRDGCLTVGGQAVVRPAGVVQGNLELEGVLILAGVDRVRRLGVGEDFLGELVGRPYYLCFVENLLRALDWTL